ncbi:hypothetical protein [Litoreibacter albidus]|nr:hypothetical protein [Litoreibacter albidus]
MRENNSEQNIRAAILAQLAVLVLSEMVDFGSNGDLELANALLDRS